MILHKNEGMISSLALLVAEPSLTPKNRIARTEGNQSGISYLCERGTALSVYPFAQHWVSSSENAADGELFVSALLLEQVSRVTA